MLIGICQISLYLPNSRSLKDKRTILAGYTNYLRKKYNISIVEIDQKNFWKKSIMGIACINDNRRLIDRVMEKIISDTERQPEIQLLDYWFSIN
jgi:uncharacterized protein YlxP (DUF503 family)